MTEYCRICGVELTDENWYLSRKNKNQHVCKKCDRASCKKYRRNNPKKIRQWHRENHLTRKYGISFPEYESMLRLQDYRCAICGRKFTKDNVACVDHDHKTGQVRALLCKQCNTGIGMLQDNPSIIHEAEMYIRKYKE